jgi:hypothetical protein
MGMSFRQRLILRAWDEHVAHEAEHQARIEVAFDRSDAFDRLGYPALALEWLDAAEALGGGLPPLYRAKRAHLARAIELRDCSGGRA